MPPWASSLVGATHRSRDALFARTFAWSSAPSFSEASGILDSTAWAFTFLGFDFPSAALGVARGNASDSGLPNLVILEQSVVPRLGPLDWLLDIIMVRRAHVSGTWGHPEEAPQAP